MGAYHLDRFNGASWTTIAVGPDPISPADYGEHRTYPYDDKRPSLAGHPGYKTRLRFVDDSTDLEVETYDWDKVLLYPNDPDSELVWGWKLTRRATYPEGAPVQHQKVGASW